MEKRKRKKAWWIILIVLAALGAAVAIWRMKAGAAAGAAPVLYQTYTVMRGNVETTVTASGTLGAAETVLVTAPDGIRVVDVPVAAGDEVKAGETLAKLDEQTVRQQLIYLRKQVTTQDNHLATAGSLDEITSPAKGRIKFIPASAGDDVLAVMKEHGTLATLSTDGYMILRVETDAELTLGSRVIVQWDGGKAKGYVDTYADGVYTVKLPDDHAPYRGKASVFYEEQEIGSGTLEINMPVEVYGYDGTIKGVEYVVDDSVPDGHRIYTLINASASVAFENRYLERNKFNELLRGVISFVDNPSIVAPCDGIVNEVGVEAGVNTGKADKADKASLAFKLAAGGARKLTVSVDELDINNVVVGQTAEITFESMPEETLTGTVTKISRIGKKENSIATYAVELEIAEDARLLIGMNGTARVLVDRAENVLTVPLEAVGEDAEGVFVYVLAADGARVRTPIETGKSDGVNAEVTSGLSEGDVISYEPAAPDMSGMMGGVEVQSSVAVEGE